MTRKTNPVSEDSDFYKGWHPLKLFFFLRVKLLPLNYLNKSSVIQSDSNTAFHFLKGFFTTSESRKK